MNKVSSVNLSTSVLAYENQLLKVVTEVMRSGRFILGKWVEQFETDFAGYHDMRYAVGVGSGTDALIFALKALGIGAGDEVITVPNSFVATAAAIAHVGAKIVFVDVDDDQNMDPEKLDAVITPATKAIIPVHLNGKPARMDKIMQIADARKIPVIEDCSQAVGASFQGKKTGTFGTLNCYSLHPLKNLGACGDAGIILTNEKELSDTVKYLRNHGLQDRDTCLKWGYNSRLDALQAAILDIKLSFIDDLTQRKRDLADTYSKELNDLPVRLPMEYGWEKCAWYTFVIQSGVRDELQKYLADNGVDALVHYPVPIHLQPAAKDLGYKTGSFPVCESQAKRILSLPIHPALTKPDVKAAAELIHRFFEIKGSTSPG